MKLLYSLDFSSKTPHGCDMKIIRSLEVSIQDYLWWGCGFIFVRIKNEIYRGLPE
jgi:hypothetical protein